MRSPLLKTVSGTIVFWGLAACSTDLPAPDLYQGGVGPTGTGTGGGLAVDCDMPPIGAVGADYSHMLSITGGTGPYTYSATGLDPLTVDGTGTITGVPDSSGTLTPTITVTDALGAEGTTSCEIEINPGLDAEVPETKAVPCVVAGESFEDFLVEGTGDGSPLTCTVLSRSGDGKLPSGITVDAESCEIQGTIDESRYGTWVWIVRAEQNGAAAHLPYCATQDQQAPDAYAISVEHDGDDTTNEALIPGTGTFAAGQAFAYGDMSSPRFEVTDDVCVGSSACYHGWGWAANASPFDFEANSADFDPTGFLTDGSGEEIGLFHHLHPAGDTVSARLADRPWVVNMSLDYCISTQDGPCDGPANVRSNGNGNLEFAIVMFPE